MVGGSRLLDFPAAATSQDDDGHDAAARAVAAERCVRLEMEAREQRRLMRQRDERSARVGPTGDAEESNRREPEGRREGMSWEDYLVWPDATRERGLEKRNIGPVEDDFVMTSGGAFRVIDANPRDGMSVTMSNEAGLVVTVHWNTLSRPVEFERRHYFKLEK